MVYYNGKKMLASVVMGSESSGESVDLSNYYNKTQTEEKICEIVPEWARAETKPTYTATEVGALPNTTVIPSVEGLASESYVDDKIGEIETAIDEIIEIQDGLQEGGSGSSGGLAIQKRDFTNASEFVEFVCSNVSKIFNIGMTLADSGQMYSQIRATAGEVTLSYSYSEWLGNSSRLYMFTSEFRNNTVILTRSILTLKTNSTGVNDYTNIDEAESTVLMQLSYEEAQAYGAVYSVYYFDEV